MMPTRRPLEFWFDFASNYSYLSVMRMRALIADAGLVVHWRPFLLGPIFKAAGWNNSPFVVQQDKGAYMWQDIVRECAKYGQPWQRPSVFPRNSLLAARVGLIGEDQPWMLDFCELLMLDNFSLDRDISSVHGISALLDSLGLNAADILAQAQSDANKQRLRERTAAAQARGIFGAPTFFVGDEMFWGNDRLADAVARCDFT
ncbi:MAG: 2-hydroxychromene-2-carboxylate isomerase [Sphingomonadaceae bacterium]